MSLPKEHLNILRALFDEEEVERYVVDARQVIKGFQERHNCSATEAFYLARAALINKAQMNIKLLGAAAALVDEES